MLLLHFKTRRLGKKLLFTIGYHGNGKTNFKTTAFFTPQENLCKNKKHIPNLNRFSRYYSKKKNSQKFFKFSKFQPEGPLKQGKTSFLFLHDRHVDLMRSAELVHFWRIFRCLKFDRHQIVLAFYPSVASEFKFV